MKALKSKMTRPLPRGSVISVCDNSGAKMIRIISVKKLQTVKGRLQAAGIGDLIIAAVTSGNQEIRKQVVPAVIVRQKKSFRRPEGMRVKFEDNAAVILKDEKGNPKGTIFKGAVAKEAAERWAPISKVAKIIV
ncbi:50S ribosomal protein L14 [archaeon]|nr:50S ribosomal protein L14 [archaeon]|tara:strand:+ start:5400 stop:5801 length:402 start_codon:yes stop_codon:yes gene_type:complete